jgi:hypothetical protein
LNGKQVFLAKESCCTFSSTNHEDYITTAKGSPKEEKTVFDLLTHATKERCLILSAG